MDFSVPYQDVLDYWFGDTEALWPPKALVRRWFQSSPAQDAAMAEAFAGRIEAALARELVEWEREASSRLALILLLDQFPRNVFRGTARAFEGDHRAATLTLEGISTGMDRRLHWAGQVFFYMPLMHAEDLELQERSEHCFADLQQRAPHALKDSIGANLAFAGEHRDIIKRFGRFPHRNQALGRESTAAERAYLETAHRYGQ